MPSDPTTLDLTSDPAQAHPSRAAAVRVERVALEVTRPGLPTRAGCRVPRRVLLLGVGGAAALAAVALLYRRRRAARGPEAAGAHRAAGWGGALDRSRAVRSHRATDSSHAAGSHRAASSGARPTRAEGRS